MNSLFGNKICINECSVPDWVVLLAGGVFFLMLLAIVVLSTCLCRVCKRVKKLKLSEGMSENTYEADVHYAELQNFPASSRGQCDGGTIPDTPANQNSDYATVAVLKEIPSEENVVSDQPKEDSGVKDGEREDHISVETE